MAVAVAQTPNVPNENQPTSAPLTVTVNDVTSAGFHNVTEMAPSGARYLRPVLYFKVQESVAATHPEWGDAADLLAVLIRPMPDVNWQYNSGQPQTIDYSGRTKVRASRPGYYIVVTGPDSAKVAALAQWLKAK